jgi:signal transduction histidine kinase
MRRLEHTTPAIGAWEPSASPRVDVVAAVVGGASGWAGDSHGDRLANLKRWGRRTLGEMVGRGGPADPEDARTTELLQGLSDAITAEMALLDADGVVIAVNAAWRGALAQLGHTAPPHDGVGLFYPDACDAIGVAFPSGPLRRRFEELLAGQATGLAWSCVVRTLQGERPRTVRVATLPAGSPARWVVIHEPAELTGSEGAEARAEDARAEERQRIAMELHDGTSQHLVALGLGMARMRRLLKRSSGAADLLEELSKLVGDVGKDIRVLSFLMRPPGLERDGLAKSARNFVHGFGLRTGITATVELEGDLDGAPPAVRHAAFRILQEASTNVVRHAGADRMDVSLVRDARGLTVRVADNGRGIPGADGEDLSGVATGVGIVSMLTRAERLGGRLSLGRRRRGAGAVVTVTLPIPLAASPEAASSAGEPPDERAMIAAQVALLEHDLGRAETDIRRRHHLMKELREMDSPTDAAEAILREYEASLGRLRQHLDRLRQLSGRAGRPWPSSQGNP